MATVLPETFKLTFGSAGMLMTPEEFDEAVNFDDEYRYELIHGVLVVNPIPSLGEADPNEELGRLLRNYREDHPQGAALNTTVSERYVRTHDSRRRADRVIWAGLRRLPNEKVDTPTIVVEFVSASRRDWKRDYIEKRQEYAALGVKEYWLIDRFRRIMTVYFSPEAEPAELVVQEKETYRTVLLPGFDLPLSRLLALADAWKNVK